MALPGSFTDPNLPAGYAPFGIQVIGEQVFVTYALQDAAKHDPIVGAGNGIVSIFDMDGNFVRRFATAGTLNAPWGITQASANFGPFSNDILIGNIGEGNINAFDPVTGHFVGEVTDGDGNHLAEGGLHGLVFRIWGPEHALPDFATQQRKRWVIRCNYHRLGQPNSSICAGHSYKHEYHAHGHGLTCTR